MDPRHVPVRSPATNAQSHASGHSSPTDTDCDYDAELNEKAALAKHAARDARASRLTTGHAHDSLLSPVSPQHSSPNSPGSSISSAAGRQLPTPVDAHHDGRTHRVSLPPRAHLDPEKAASYDAYDVRSQHRAGPDAVIYDKSEYHEQGPEDKAWQLLFYLSGPCALLSIAITLWTLIATLIALLLLPLRFCTSRPPLSAQLTAFLAPALNLQLHLVYSFDASESYSVPMLLVIHLFSPVIALGVAVASWTAAGFWFFSSILGDPGGHDGGRHNDGKDSILGVRNYWERWLSRGLR